MCFRLVWRELCRNFNILFHSTMNYNFNHHQVREWIWLENKTKSNGVWASASISLLVHSYVCIRLRFECQSPVLSWQRCNTSGLISQSLSARIPVAALYIMLHAVRFAFKPFDIQQHSVGRRAALIANALNYNIIYDSTFDRIQFLHVSNYTRIPHLLSLVPMLG